MYRRINTRSWRATCFLILKKCCAYQRPPQRNIYLSMHRLREETGIPRDFILSLTKLQDVDFSREYILQRMSERLKSKHISAQKELPLSIQATGVEIACAHLMVALGGAVKFYDHAMWHKKNKSGRHNLPNTYIEGLSLEAIDISKTDIRFEGIQHIADLEKLSCLDISGCRHVDDWCIASLHPLSHSLKYLNISSCSSLTGRGLENIQRLRNLHRLTVHDLPAISNKELICLMLEDLLPHCLVEGIDYNTALENSQSSALSTEILNNRSDDEAFDSFLRHLGYGGDPVKREYFTDPHEFDSTEEIGVELNEEVWRKLVEEELMAEVEEARRQHTEKQTHTESDSSSETAVGGSRRHKGAV